MTVLTDLMPLQWITAVLLLSLRIGAMLLATPVFSAADLPIRVRVVVVIGLSIALCAALGLVPDAAGASRDALKSLGEHPLGLLRSACTEIALGLVLSMAIHAAFAAFAIAGQLLDVQLGLGLSQVFNPASDTATPVLSAAFSRVAVVVFFVTDGHHALIRALAFSLQRLPLGQPWPLADVLPALAGSLAGLFGLCIALAAPVIFCLLMTEMALGVLARNLPQVNMLMMGIPVRIIVGLAALCVWFSAIGGAMDRVYRGLYQALDAAIVGLPATAALGGVR
ncbi:MAG TPA: flagellar biosynthetic protein FliR [Burkholderiaceae bacterium]